MTLHREEKARAAEGCKELPFRAVEIRIFSFAITPQVRIPIQKKLPKEVFNHVVKR